MGSGVREVREVREVVRRLAARRFGSGGGRGGASCQSRGWGRFPPPPRDGRAHRGGSSFAPSWFLLMRPRTWWPLHQLAASRQPPSPQASSLLNETSYTHVLTPQHHLRITSAPSGRIIASFNLSFACPSRSRLLFIFCFFYFV